MTRKRKPGRRTKTVRPQPDRRRSSGTRPVDPLSPAPSLPLDDFVGAAAEALALPIRPEWLAAITANLEVNLRMAALVAEFPLPDELAPAPVFEP
jgi:hypothetical protein